MQKRFVYVLKNSASCPMTRLSGTAMFRVVDESGEDYLFSADRFVTIEVPTAVRASLLKASRA